ncbi:polysaccharide biosynthesis protein [Algoriphagus aquimarinus]|uniref:NAD-dependent epimerase/dehydratase family protein n=1 Tax=Algoriphagus aquimarinus TaxID=237018 RepID=A0A5C7AK41_9BACT|nr:polysaccharide biosynthesis protein [Algoriphagus aquimarinus]TXE08801.1 NAD-dependent epimerase/dehydratase family protein [Algoriphagus aquimarinus]|tara:strand:+ start:4219 stop:5169 length:951 start_codon:yes stop_codon:yes gene_type:complete
MKTILITGGTGFLGRNLALKLKNEYRIILTGRNNKQNLFASKYTGCQVAPLDISNIESVRDVFVEFKPDIVIHAAATKFVDLAEKYPMECVDVNILGSQNVARVAVEREIPTVIGISTDKAAPPVRNIYGMSKSVMERIFCAMDGKSATKFTAVRYGNVAWSTGSVLTIWKKMLEETGMIGTTGPEMRRFFFSVDEAVNLVVTAMDNIDLARGKVLSRYMKAAQMQDILQTWIEEKGGKWEKIEGRPGERDDEFLIGDLELAYTEELEFDGIKHYLISFNDKVKNPVSFGLSSANTDKLTREEILSIINNPPIEEQ